MIPFILRKELTELRRDRRLWWLALIILALTAVATVNGIERALTAAHERAAAEAADRDIWLGQGEKNPHSAAHFARYAFKPVPALSFFDPGIIDYAGLAVWMEAHHRNPAVFRAAEDGGALQRSAALSPAWILRLLGPLLIIIILYPAYAAERQRGTLRQLVSMGVSPAKVFRGKLGAALVALGAVMATIAIVTAVAIAVVRVGDMLPDTGIRIMLLAGSYGVYLLLFTLLALAVSALARTSQEALVALLLAWAVTVVFWPRLSADLGERLYPSPDHHELKKRFSDETSAPFWRGEEGKQRQEEIKHALLKRYEVTDIADLPVNYDAILLQESEEFANPRFDRIYDHIWAGYDGQARVARVIAVLSPTLALARLSAALSGTDIAHHRTFLEAAEAHRRIIIRQLNQDMAQNADDRGYEYLASAALWAQSPDFHHTPPSFGNIAADYWPEMAILLFWLVLVFLFARWAVARVQPLEASS